MNHRYLAGTFIAAGLLLAAWIAFGAWWEVASAARLPIVFDPEIIDARLPPILAGEERQIEVVVHNTLGHSVPVHSVRFSCSCASLAPPYELPREFPPGATARMLVRVKPEDGMRGRLRLQIDLNGGQLPAVSGIGLALFDIVGHLNSEPAILACGSIPHEANAHVVVARLWYPKGTEAPEVVTVSSSDPAITAETRCKDVVEDGDRVYFADLVVAIDPTIANARFREDLSIKYDGREFHVPITGFIVEHLESDLNQ